MPHFYRTLLVLLLVLSFNSVFADQRARFSSRATQGYAWNGTSQIIREKIAITVLADHLDVEHEFEMDVQSQGSWSIPSHPNALEIVGQLIMDKSTVFTGLLLWNGEVILKGKLQTKEMARQKYEEVVDRNVTNPPPPRDPALLEYVSDDWNGQSIYNLSIFPVALGKTRKIRLRYLLPSSFQDGAQGCPFPHAFSILAKVNIQGGAGIQGYALTSSRPDMRKVTLKNEQDIKTPLELDPTAFQSFQPFYYWGGSTGIGGYIRYVTPLFGEDKGSQLFIASTTHQRGLSGHAAHFVFRPPQELLSDTTVTEKRILAWVRSEKDSAGKEIALNGLEASGLEDLRVFSSTTLADSIIWRLYQGQELAREVVEKPHLIRMEDGNQFVRTFGHKPFYPMSSSMPKSLAASWGFIDAKYALLALEQDSLPSDLARQYVAAGVPNLDTSDIFPEEGSLDQLPLSAWLMQRNLDRDELLKPIAITNTLGLPQGIRWLIRDGALHIEIDAAAMTRDLRISLHDLAGKKIHAWDANAVASGRLSWKPQSDAAGTYLLRIVNGTQVYSARVVLR